MVLSTYNSVSRSHCSEPSTTSFCICLHVSRKHTLVFQFCLSPLPHNYEKKFPIRTQLLYINLRLQNYNTYAIVHDLLGCDCVYCSRPRHIMCYAYTFLYFHRHCISWSCCPRVYQTLTSCVYVYLSPHRLLSVCLSTWPHTFSYQSLAFACLQQSSLMFSKWKKKFLCPILQFQIIP